ncbi:response regulator transcription factor [uncultured Sphaerochaeta sp.]|uniref:response regulator transcription factor n=1 Tax=uncultured Sphaerochaeta sp. TaxID=886478 RepID=UPI002AA646E4|nr:response regulator transcription factor [uncultured Sphaerochaeta sp.]
MTNVVLVEDQSLFRTGLVAIIERFDEVRVVAEYTNGQDFLDSREYLTSGACDLVFLDLSLPGKSGMEILHELEPELGAFPPICILSMFPPAFYVEKVKALGVQGYLSKDCSMEALHQAIVRISQGYSHFPEGEGTLTEPMALNHLSIRESEVFKLLTRGLTLKEIAFELHVSVKSISTYKSRLMIKLGAESLSDLYKIAVMYHESSK